MRCLIRIEDRLIITTCKGYKPKNCLMMLPKDTPANYVDFVVFGKDGKPFICEKKKSAWMKEQIKNAVSE